MSISAADFRKLCRSSPWKWQSLRFELSWLPAGSEAQRKQAAAVEPLRCWVRRPQALRVEDSAGSVLFSTTGINDSKDNLFTSGSRKPWLLPAHLVTPIYDDDGLVRRRPEAAYAEPHFGDPRFAAVLDPVELAGMAPVPLEFPFANLIELGDITEGTQNGRPVIETIAVANSSYAPSTPGGPLLYPGRTGLRIDVETGVCVASQALDGEKAGEGHWLNILAVDEYMLDDLFTTENFGLTDVRQHIPWQIPGSA